MATSNITKNFAISGKEQVEMFVHAIEESAQSRPVRTPVATRFVSDEAESIEFLEKKEKTAATFRLTEYPLYLYGAKSVALGACLAIKKLYPGQEVCGFIVKSLVDNPETLAGLPVRQLADLKEKNIYILIATPEDLHEEIISDLEEYGFRHYTCLDSQRESLWMERYFKELCLFPSIHMMFQRSEGCSKFIVYAVKSSRDKTQQILGGMPDWVHTIWVGAALGGECRAEERDDNGEHISEKNRNYCELTALYWMWKNKVKPGSQEDGRSVYYGLFHYRRMLDINDTDIQRLIENNIDVVLPFPTIHEPDIYEHHTRYVREADWDAMRQALKELQPEYAKVFPSILSQPYFYNYNMLVAKASVLDQYCEWLFPILERTEDLTTPKGNERSDRYIGYLGENLLTLYFMYHRNDLRIAHTGRKMLV